MTNTEGYLLPEHPEQPGPQAPPRKPKTGLIIGVVVGVLALVGGGVALSSALQGDTAPGASPQNAVTSLVEALNKGDAVGVLDRLHPAEAKAFRDFALTTAGEMKRLEVIRGDADPLNITGSFSAQEIGFDAEPEEKINDRISIVKLVKGKVSITADTAKQPYTEKFVKLLGEQATATTSKTTTVDIADVVRRTGKPVRVAAVKVGASWHPSLYYSAADYMLQAAKRSWPKEQVPAKGADTPEQAVRELVTAAIDGNTRRVIELLPPTEMAVAHDIGHALSVELSGETASDTKLIELKTETKDIPGGKRISPRKVVVETGGERITVAREGDCVQFEAGGQGKRVMCLDQVIAGMELQATESGIELPEDVVHTIQNVGRSMLDVGVATVEEGGKHYLSPTGTVNELFLTFLRGLDAKGFAALTQLGNR